MVAVEKLTTFDRPELAPYKTMRFQEKHRADRIFVAEGEKVVRRLAESPIPIKSALMPEHWFESFRPLLEPRPELVRVFLADKELLQDLTGFSMYQGVLAIGEIPPSNPLEELLRLPSPQLLVAVEGLSNAENIGVLVRNATALGAQALLVGETCSHPYLRRAVRSSMGTIFTLPVVEPPNLAAALGQLGHHGIHCVAAHPHSEDRHLPDADLTRPLCMVLGSEGLGLSAEVLRQCREQVVVPMAAGVDSLNVSNAAAIFLYEAWRQRREQRGRV